MKRMVVCNSCDAFHEKSDFFVDVPHCVFDRHIRARRGAILFTSPDKCPLLNGTFRKPKIVEIDGCTS